MTLLIILLIVRILFWVGTALVVKLIYNVGVTLFILFVASIIIWEIRKYFRKSQDVKK